MYMHFTIAYTKDWKRMWTNNHGWLIRVMGLWMTLLFFSVILVISVAFYLNVANITFKILEIIYYIEWINCWLLLLLLFSHSVVSDSLQPHGLQHTRLPCPSPAPGAFSKLCPLSWWCHTTILSSVVPLLLLLSIFPSIRVFSNESSLRTRWPKYWSFSLSISPSNEYSGLISFRIDWFDFLAVQGNLKSLLQD